MSSPYGPAHAPVGDVGTALMLIDSQLKAIRAGRTEHDPEQKALSDQFMASLGPEGAVAVLDGTCTVIYMFMSWLRQAHEHEDKDVIEYVVPTLVASLRLMPRSVRPETIPTMSALVIAAGTGLSPTLWREQYGDWTEKEITALEATTFLLAEHISRVTEDPDFAVRMVTEALANAEDH
ncbi:MULTISPECIES: hypothetical protein [Streptomyces]|uniref:Uncharacterized protein n=1 Tax=Streptomyces albus (strain ATCC 21838 / DSM 41398 / FERM P-419 / JCM 4703 / NBRC 107858) TaxID=1081613 RepID=A0A0B5F7B3_STRA4|nr:hypothetical protein [Streptomyces sp. SCSIO ZS0520]AJE86756.1 hypothetical protein SLNWT_6380 [Streptomyces albus]AOU81060.1 hypothetical protein SLNHY_6369 [Streptomyces albus]